MASKREAVLAAVVTALGVVSVTGTTKPSGLSIHRMRTRKLNQDELPAMVVWWGGDDRPDNDATSKADRTMNVWVECRAKQSGSSPDAALDPFYVWAVKALMLDHTLGAKCMDIVEAESVPDLEEKEEGLCAMAVKFAIRYQSKIIDPEGI